MPTVKEEYLRRVSKRMRLVLRTWYLQTYSLKVFISRNLSRREIDAVYSGESEDYSTMFGILTTMISHINTRELSEYEAEVFATKALLELPALTIEGLTKKLEELNNAQARLDNVEIVETSVCLIAKPLR